jgi:Zn-dependent peptidase ImmA (M78 family)
VDTSFTPPILSYEDINNHAMRFLKEHWVNEQLPVPIEEIIEFNLGLDIIPFPGLQRDFDIDGFIAGDLTCIYVDDFIFQHRPARYRFTLAHEIGHLVFHKDLIESIRPAGVSEWKDFISGVDIETYDWLEWQAYAFAGLLLVPREHLLQHVKEHVKRLQSKIEVIKAKGLPRDSYQEYVINAIASKLIEIYDVSVDVLYKRISKEIEKGNILIP